MATAMVRGPAALGRAITMVLPGASGAHGGLASCGMRPAPRAVAPTHIQMVSSPHVVLKEGCGTNTHPNG